LGGWMSGGRGGGVLGVGGAGGGVEGWDGRWRSGMGPRAIGGRAMGGAARAALRAVPAAECDREPRSRAPRGADNGPEGLDHGPKGRALKLTTCSGRRACSAPAADDATAARVSPRRDLPSLPRQNSLRRGARPRAEGKAGVVRCRHAPWAGAPRSPGAARRSGPSSAGSRGSSNEPGADQRRSARGAVQWGSNARQERDRGPGRVVDGRCGDATIIGPAPHGSRSIGNRQTDLGLQEDTTEY
jgi:hypothetical protein